MPTEADVRRALALIRSRADREYFYSRLRSPEWIPALLAAGEFAHPPEIEREGTYFTFPVWPASTYLSRTAAFAPSLAAEALRTIPLNDNQLVLEDLVSVALAIAPEAASSWTIRLSERLSDLSWLIHPLATALLRLAAHLGNSGFHETSLQLLRRLLEPIPEKGHTRTAEASASLLPPTPHARVDRHDYVDLAVAASGICSDLPNVAGLRLLAGVLSQAESLSHEEGAAAAPTDYSFIWYERIEDDTLDIGDIRAALVRAVRTAATNLANRGLSAEVFEVLREQPWDLFRRIALHVTRVVEPPDTSHWRLLVMSEEAFRDPAIHHEYVLLLRELFPRLASAEQATVLSWIDEGPPRDPMRERHRAFAGSELSLDLEHQWVEQWQRDRLSPLTGSLPEEWEARLRSLVARHGPPEFDFALTKSSGVYSRVERSPIDGSSIQKLDSVSLRRFLTDFVPTAERDGPSRSGAARELRAQDDDFFLRESREAPLWADQHPEYISAILDGLEGLVRRGIQISWHSVVTLLGRVVARDQSSQAGQWMLRSAASLLRASAEPGSAESPVEAWPEISLVLRRILDASALPNELQEDALKADRAVSIAINSVRGVAVEALVRLAVRAHRERTLVGSSRFDQGLSSALFAQLRSLAAGVDNWSRVDHVMLGMHLNEILWIEGEWASELVNLLFPDPSDRLPSRRLAWSAFILYGMPTAGAFRACGHEYVRALDEWHEEDADAKAARRLDARLGEHLVTLYWQGVEFTELASVLDRWFRTRSDSQRRACLEFVGRALGTTGDVPPEVLARLMSLLDRRIAESRRHDPAISEGHGGGELRAFAWWFGSGRFDDAWSLNRLRQVLALEGSVSPLHMVLERLSLLADQHPASVSECLLESARHVTQNRDLHVYGAQILSLLERLVASSSARASGMARTTAELLVEAGMREFRPLTRLRNS